MKEKWYLVTTDIDYSCSCSVGWPDGVYGPFSDQDTLEKYRKKNKLRGYALRGTPVDGP